MFLYDFGGFGNFKHPVYHIAVGNDRVREADAPSTYKYEYLDIMIRVIVISLQTRCRILFRK